MFISTLQTHLPTILKQLHLKYLSAINVIKSELIKSFSEKLKATVDELAVTEFKFTLKKAIESGWIKINFNTNQSESELVNLISLNENAYFLPLGLVLAHLLTGNKIDVKGKIDLNPGSVTSNLINSCCDGLYAIISKVLLLLPKFISA